MDAPTVTEAACGLVPRRRALGRREAIQSLAERSRSGICSCDAGGEGRGRYRGEERGTAGIACRAPDCRIQIFLSGDFGKNRVEQMITVLQSTGYVASSQI